MAEESGTGVGPGGEGRHAPPPTGGGAVQVIPLLYDFILWMAPKLAHPGPRIRGALFSLVSWFRTVAPGGGWSEDPWHPA
jgi:hypothetical protein